MPSLFRQMTVLLLLVGAVDSGCKGVNKQTKRHTSAVGLMTAVEMLPTIISVIRHCAISLWNQALAESRLC